MIRSQGYACTEERDAMTGDLYALDEHPAEEALGRVD
jgi:hypothetical protein